MPNMHAQYCAHNRQDTSLTAPMLCAEGGHTAAPAGTVRCGHGLLLGVTPQQACAQALTLIADLMNRTDVLKVGVQCAEDAMRMRKMCGAVRPCSVVDLVVRSLRQTTHERSCRCRCSMQLWVRSLEYGLYRAQGTRRHVRPTVHMPRARTNGR